MHCGHSEGHFHGEAEGCREGRRDCPALARLPGAPDDPPGLEREVRALLGCRSFLWDVLLDGDWTGCARPRIRELSARYGAKAVAQAFGE